MSDTDMMTITIDGVETTSAYLASRLKGNRSIHRRLAEVALIAAAFTFSGGPAAAIPRALATLPHSKNPRTHPLSAMMTTAIAAHTT